MSGRYLLKRLALIFVTLLIVSFVVFAVTQILPGNAAVMILGEYATPGQREALELQLGLDRPWFVQFGTWLGGILTGDWGTSMRLQAPVAAVVVEALSRSLALAVSALLVVTVVAVPLGVIAAARRGTKFDLGVSLLSYAGIALPEFVTATLLLVFLGSPDVGLLPAGGYVPLREGLGPFLLHLVLPTMALSLILTAHIARQTRSEMVDVLQSDYIRTAVLKGLSRRVVLLRHALRNALAPAIAVIALDIGYLIGGILVVEEVFAYPGVGRLMMFALQNRDLPLIQAGTLVLAGTYAITNLIADLIYAVLDRRVRYE
ncbi:MAG: ABC transporter permease [Proteobacteria bacterium]|nr:ABC transporter permease [Pseudomonadota bacterium]